MAQNTSIAVARETWTQLTDADVTAITFQNTSIYPIKIKATTDTTAPTTDDGAITYAPGQGERNAAMSDLFPGLTGADRVWAWAPQACRIMVSHA